MSLRWFHFVFVILVIAGADLVAALILRRDGASFSGIATSLIVILGGFGLAVYSIVLARKFEQAHIQ